jgi:hypothetical protein
LYIVSGHRRHESSAGATQPIDQDHFGFYAQFLSLRRESPTLRLPASRFDASQTVPTSGSNLSGVAVYNPLSLAITVPVQVSTSYHADERGQS